MTGGEVLGGMVCYCEDIGMLLLLLGLWVRSDPASKTALGRVTRVTVFLLTKEKPCAFLFLFRSLSSLAAPSPQDPR